MSLVRTMKAGDLLHILDIQAHCYEEQFHEALPVLEAKLDLSPKSCWVVEGDAGLKGYLFAHPWLSTAPPAWNAVLSQLPDTADCFYLHDLAVAPNARGQGVAEALIAAARQETRGLGFTLAALTAVQGSVPFWSKHGFRACDHKQDSTGQHLKTYGDNACFMTAHWPI